MIKKSQSEPSTNAESSGDSDSSLSDADKETTPLHNFSIAWIKKLFENGFVKHLLDLVLSIQMGKFSVFFLWSLSLHLLADYCSDVVKNSNLR